MSLNETVKQERSNLPWWAERFGLSIWDWCKVAHEEAQKWWHNPDGSWKERNKGEMFALMHSELSEAMEAERKDLMDTHLSDRKGVEVELADLLIRVFDYAGRYDLDLEAAVMDKLLYNRERPDHTDEARASEHGKKW